MKKRITLLLVLMVSFMLAWSAPNDGDNTDDSTNISTSTSAAHKTASADKARIKKQLVGEWGINGILIRQASAKIQVGMTYSFHSNGMYSKILNNQEINITEVGNWEISEDGKSIILHAHSKHCAEKVRIKLLDLDEMVLEQSLTYEAQGINVKSNDYFFNKR